MSDSPRATGDSIVFTLPLVPFQLLGARLGLGALAATFAVGVVIVQAQLQQFMGMHQEFAGIIPAGMAGIVIALVLLIPLAQVGTLRAAFHRGFAMAALMTFAVGVLGAMIVGQAYFHSSWSPWSGRGATIYSVYGSPADTGAPVAGTMTSPTPGSATRAATATAAPAAASSGRVSTSAPVAGAITTPQAAGQARPVPATPVDTGMERRLLYRIANQQESYRLEVRALVMSVLVLGLMAAGWIALQIALLSGWLRTRPRGDHESGDGNADVQIEDTVAQAA